MKYLEIVTETENGGFTHFIDLRKEKIEEEIKSLIWHLEKYKGQKIIKVKYTNTKLTNW